MLNHFKMFEEVDSEAKRHDQVEQMPIYKKAREIMKLADKIVALVPKEEADIDENDDDFEAIGALLEHQAR